MIRFIHTADNHLGSPFVGLREADAGLAHQAMQASVQAFERVVSIAIREQVDFVLMVGDLYDATKQHVRERQCVWQALNRLRDADISVFYSHGNHDYGVEEDTLLPKHVYSFSSEGKTHILTTRHGERVAVSGFSYVTRWRPDSALKDFPVRDQSVDYHIGMYHGELGQSNSRERQVYAPFSMSEMKALHYDYWALGHIHQRTLLSEQPPIVYPGNTQGTSFKEMGDKGVYLVQVDKGQPPLLEFIRTQVIEWRECRLSIAGVTTMTDLVSACVATVLEASWQETVTFVRLVVQCESSISPAWRESARLAIHQEVQASLGQLSIIDLRFEERQSFPNSLFLLTPNGVESRMQQIQNTALQHAIIARYLSSELMADEFRERVQSLAMDWLTGYHEEEDFDANQED